jgi:hypothetical protein
VGSLIAQAGAVAGGRAPGRLGEVVQQVPPVGGLDGERGAAGRALGVAAAPVPADHLYPRPAAQPRLERLRGSLRQHVDGPAGLDVDEHGAVDMPAAQREVIHAEDPRGGDGQVGQGADQPQQRGPAGRGRQPAGQPGAGPAAECQGDRLQRPGQPGGAPRVPAGQGRDLLGEGDGITRFVSAEEPADLQVD